MAEFIVYPAIDLRDGRVVRLRQGKGDQQKVYADAPELTAQDWINQGASWLHVVNLNGAFGEATELNMNAIRKIIKIGRDRAQVQLGGGIRTIGQIRAALDLGVSRVVLGTAIMENPNFTEEVLAKFDEEQIAFGLDAKGKELMSRGWQSGSGKDVFELAELLAKMGAKTIIYTNIQKDGMQSGVDWENTKQLADRTGLRVIASGGTTALEDIVNVQRVGLAGVIVGRALYEGNFTLKEALNVC